MNHKIYFATQNDVLEICHFIWLYYEPCKKWNPTYLNSWVSWYCLSNLCVVARELVENGNRVFIGHIRTLLIGRPVKEVERVHKEIYYYDHDGDTFFIDLVILNGLPFGILMKDMMVKSVGMKDYLAFTRDNGNIRIHKYKLGRMLKYYEPH